jgi:hypothetical protein
MDNLGGCRLPRVARRDGQLVPDAGADARARYGAWPHACVAPLEDHRLAARPLPHGGHQTVASVLTAGGVFTAEIVAARQRHALEAGGEGCHERCWAAVKRHRLLHHRGPNHPVPLGYSIEWLTCAFASRSDVALVSLPGAAQDRLLAHMPYAVDSPHRLTRWASSSRRQRARRTASAAACLAWEALSASVRCRPPLSVVIVTHLVTRPIASRCRERLLIGKLVSYWRVAAPGEPGSESGAQAAGLRITV